MTTSIWLIITSLDVFKFAYFLIIISVFLLHSTCSVIFSLNAFAVYNNYLFIFIGNVFLQFTHTVDNLREKPVDNIIFMRMLWRLSFYWVDFRSYFRRGKRIFNWQLTLSVTKNTLTTSPSGHTYHNVCLQCVFN